MYAYDDNGNLMTRTAKVGGAITGYTYNAEDRMIRVDLPDGSWAEYRYDALDRRIEKNVNGTIVRYTYDREDILFEYDSSNNVVARFTHGPGIDEPVIVARDTDANGSLDAVNYYHADHLGTIRSLTDSAGAIAHTYTYDSFGQVVAHSGNVLNPYTFTGRELDPETGLYYYRARYYAPQLGRFLSPDPLGIQGEINMYLYVSANPVNFTDPFGLFWIPPFPGSEAAGVLALSGEAAWTLCKVYNKVKETNEIFGEDFYPGFPFK